MRLKTALTLSASLLILGATPLPGRAADCAALLAQAKAERGIVEKKTLLEKAAEACPNEYGVAVEYASSLERLRKYNEALTWYERAAALPGAEPRALFGMGDVRMLVGDIDGAVSAYERGLKKAPGDSRMIRTLELARVKLKSEAGDPLTPEEFVWVMSGRERGPSSRAAMTGPVLRMPIRFPGGSAEIDRGSLSLLDAAGRAMNQSDLADVSFEISCVADDGGSSARNLSLSQERAQAVLSHLTSRHKVATERLTALGVGDKEGGGRRIEFRRVK